VCGRPSQIWIRTACAVWPDGDFLSEDRAIRPDYTKVKTFGKFVHPYPIKGLRLPQDMTEIASEKRLIGHARAST